MKTMKKLSAVIIAVLMLAVTLSACGVNVTIRPLENTEADEIDTEMEVRLSVLSGTTGWGAVKLLNDAAEGTAALNYTTTIESSVKVMMDALIAGEVDFAAMPTNKAAMIASATNGAVQVVAVNTLGVMSMCSVNEITSWDDLHGVTIAVPEEPSYILVSLLAANGIEDAVVETYATPADLLALVVSGEVATAVLPEPLLTAACVKNQNMKVVMNLTEEWDKVYDGQLMQGCMVVRTAFAEEHKAEVDAFLSEYEESIKFSQENAEEASALIESYFGTGAPVAAKALSRCNLTFLSGNDMKTGLQSLYDILITVPSSNIGAGVPSDAFYYGAE